MMFTFAGTRIHCVDVGTVIRDDRFSIETVVTGKNIVVKGGDCFVAKPFYNRLKAACVAPSGPLITDREAQAARLDHMIDAHKENGAAGISPSPFWKNRHDKEPA